MPFNPSDLEWWTWMLILSGVGFMGLGFYGLITFEYDDSDSPLAAIIAIIMGIAMVLFGMGLSSI